MQKLPKIISKIIKSLLLTTAIVSIFTVSSFAQVSSFTNPVAGMTSNSYMCTNSTGYRISFKTAGMNSVKIKEGYNQKFVYDTQTQLGLPISNLNTQFDYDNNGKIAGSDVLYAQQRLTSQSSSAENMSGAITLANGPGQYTLECFGPMGTTPATSGYVVDMVSQPPVCTTDYSPVCAYPKNSCTSISQSCAQPAPETYSNICQMNAAGATFISNGACESAVTTTGVQVSLANVQPNYVLIGGQANQKIADFVFSGTGIIKKVKLLRTGVSSNSAITNAYLYEGSTLLGGAMVADDGSINFGDINGLVNLNGVSKTISVRVDVGNNNAGQTVGVSFQGYAFNISDPITYVGVNGVLNGPQLPIAGGSGTSSTTDFMMYSDSRVSQYVIADGIREFKINGTISPITNGVFPRIRDVFFRFYSSASAPTTVTLGNITVAVIGDRASIYGLNYDAGKSLTFSFKPACVIPYSSCTGVSGGNFSLGTSTISYITADNTQKTAYMYSALPTYTMVAGKPIIKVNTLNTLGLVNGIVKIGEFTVEADSGDIKIGSFPIKVVKNGNFSLSNFELRDNSGVKINSNVNFISSEPYVQFNPIVPYIISASSGAQKFSIYANVSGLTSSVVLQSTSFTFGDKSVFSWGDVLGGAVGLNGNLLTDYPTNSQITTSSGSGVATTTCTSNYAPVCGQIIPACLAFGCKIMTPAPTTYSNRCEMQKAGASFVSEGACGGVATSTSLINLYSSQPKEIDINKSSNQLMTFSVADNTPVYRLNFFMPGNERQFSQNMYLKIKDQNGVETFSNRTGCYTILGAFNCDFGLFLNNTKVLNTSNARNVYEVYLQTENFSNSEKEIFKQSQYNFQLDSVKFDQDLTTNPTQVGLKNTLYLKGTTPPIGDVGDGEDNGQQCLDLTYNLKLRSRDANTNNEVSDLQDYLNNAGYLASEPTGYFGQGTLAAVKKFQKENGLTPSGIVGRYTRAKIKSLTCDDFTPVPMPLANSNRVFGEIATRRIDAFEVTPIGIQSPGDNFTMNFRALNYNFAGTYSIYAWYKDSTKGYCLLSTFTPTVNIKYAVIRNSTDICKNNSQAIGALSDIDYISIEKTK